MKRFDLVFHKDPENEPSMEEKPSGLFVLHSDYAAVLAQKEALEKKLETARKLVFTATEQISRRDFYEWHRDAKAFLEAPHEAK